MIRSARRRPDRAPAGWLALGLGLAALLGALLGLVAPAGADPLDAAERSASAPRLDRIDTDLAGPYLRVAGTSGAVALHDAEVGPFAVELELRAAAPGLVDGRMAELAKQLASGGALQLVVRQGDTDVLVTEVHAASVDHSFAPDAALAARIRLELEEAPVVWTAVRSSAPLREDAARPQDAAVERLVAPGPGVEAPQAVVLVPEPATAALLAAGLLGLVFAGRGARTRALSDRRDAGASGAAAPSRSR